MEGNDGESPYTRADFLRFNAATKGDNKDVFEGFDASSDFQESVETKERWADFANWTDHPTLAEGEGLELIGWSLFHFAPCVVHKNRLPPTSKWAVTPLDQWLTIDDIAFILLTLENCINKWIRLYNQLLKKRREAVEDGKNPASVCLTKKEEMAATRGAKFPAGSGVSGIQGQKRFNGLKLWIKRNYYDDTTLAKQNSEALKAQLDALVVEEEERRMGDSERSKSTRRQEAAAVEVRDPELDDLHDLEWLRCMNGNSLMAV